MTSGLKDMWDAIPADIGIPKDVMDKARVALAYAQTQASEGDTEAAIAIIGKAIMAERERCASVVEKVSHEGIHGSMWERKFQNTADMIRRGDA